jgi:TonB family protein
MCGPRNLGLYCAAFLMCTVIASPRVFAAGPKIIWASGPAVLAMFPKKYTPSYPYEARRSHMEGSGVFRMYVDENGIVSRVGIIKSTGYKLLDVNASYGLLYWRTKPGHRREVDLPVIFRLH